ncbi:MAG: AraC family transcriptional regulator [Candidatus Limnocylindrales bacterium]
MDADLLPVLVHIQAGLDKDLSLTALSRSSGLSESTLKRRIEATTGETPRRYVERLRLERAASQLMLRQSTVLEIALDNGFHSHEVFTRAFTRRFGRTPSEWRDQQTAGGLGRNERQPGLSETIEGAAISSTRVVELRDIEVAFLRHTGPYDQVDAALWGQVRRRLAELGRSIDGLPLGIAQDPPHITPPERLRFDAGWTIDGDLPPECGLGQQTVRGGTYAVTTYVGPFSRIGYAYELIGHRFADRPEMVVHGAAVEWYRTGSIDEETYLNQVDIAFPVKAGPDSPRVLG